MKNKTNTIMVSNRHKKKRLVTRALVMMMFMALFTQAAQAQSTIVYMKDGSFTIQRSTGAIDFYDSHGPSQQTNYWEKWYSHNENFTYVFKPAEAGDKIKVTFNSFAAYAEPADPNSAIGDPIGNWTLRLNEDFLRIYQGNGAVEANMIAELTGNSQLGFSVMSDGAITFQFSSNGQYREEGWYATVELVTTSMAPQKPFIQRSTCSDQVEIFPTTLGAQIVYSIDGSEPSIEYTGPISFPDGTIPSGGFTVKAKSKLADGNNWSSVSSVTFKESDRVPIPGVATITRTPGTNTIVMTPATRPSGLNDTYQVRYTMSTNGTEPPDPTYNNSTVYSGPLTATVDGTIFKAKTFAVSCYNQFSATTTRYEVEGIQVPAPIIDFDAMTITDTVAGTTFEILYTLDGTIPAEVNPDDPDNMPIGIYSATQVDLSSLTLSPGQTVRAMAYRSNNDEWHTCDYDYIPSQVVTAIYIPSTGSGTYNNTVVLLDDREDHTWSYYSDTTCAIKRLKPADIKITYYGNSPAGRTTMTNASENGVSPTTFSAIASGVAVNHDAPESQFIYLKTLEAANENGTGGYPYTMIPNPFQKRPVLSASTTERTFVVTLANYDTDDNWAGYGDTPATVTVSFSNGGSQVLNGPSSSTPTTAVSYTFTKPIGTTVTVYFDKGDQRYPTYCVAAVLYQDGETILAEQRCPSSSGNLTQFTVAAASGNEANKYRGFYAWRIKSLSSGLTISGKSVGETINADEEIVFNTTKEDGNEVEFEALWAQAYRTTTTSTSGLNPNVSYERNFMVLSSNPGTSNTTTDWPTSSSTTYTNGSNLPLYTYSSSYPYSITQQIYTPEQIGGAGRITQIAFNVRTRQNSSRTLKIYLTHTALTSIPTDDNNNYRTIPIDVTADIVYNGSYNFNSTGWRSITLTNPFDYNGTSNLVVTVIDDSGSSHSSVFYTYSSGGTRSIYGYDSEAISGYISSYYYNGTTSTYNNQIRFTKAVSNLAGITVPLTMTTYNPDGTGGSSSVTLSESMTCGADLKFENIKMNAIPFIDGNGNNLVIGRGVTSTNSNGYCANNVYGFRIGENTTADVAFKTRVESGRFENVHLLTDINADNLQAHELDGTADIYAVFGNDYDRANKANDVPYTYDISLGYGMLITGGNSKYNIVVKSGTNGNNGSTVGDRFYMGIDLIPSIDSHVYGTYNRNVTILGGIFNGEFAGGINGYMGPTTDPNRDAIRVRIKGGTFTKRVYMGGTRLPGYGNRHLVVTGGTFSTFITGGCYGYDENSGITYGSSEIYFGGKANQTSDLGLFGSGYGSTAVYGTTDEDSYYVTATKVVVADQAQVAGSVYGGGNNGYALNGSDVYVLGGTVAGNVFGGSNQSKGAVINVTQKGGTISGNLYGGSNVKGTISGLATVNVSGGTVTNVYGGGYGSNTTMSTNGTKVTVTGGTINNNVYGGGEQGVVSGKAIVSFEGGTVTDIYGAGKGTKVTTPGASASANVAQGTTVNVKGGLVKGAVYGGGEFGTVAFTSSYGTSSYGSTVSISGGEVKGDVFGGGKEGSTQGATTVNISGTQDGTILRGNVYAGAYGEHDKFYVAGLKTLNISGGRIYGSVYGGSRNANDGNTLNPTGGSAATSVTNICGGRIDQHVYAAGYYGSTKGSVYAFIGLSAINDAPNHSKTTGFSYDKNSLLIGGNVWAGGDWGVFTGEFGAATITGNSNIYINGEGYSTEGNDQSATNYMDIQGSIIGSGTSCDAGALERTLILSHYGADIANGGDDSDENPFSRASRQVNSIQRFKNVIFDDAKLGFVGQGKINSLSTTERYSIYEISENLYLANGSSLVMNVPSSQIYSFHSVTIDDAYTDAASAYHVVNYDGLGSTGGATDNKVRVNGGSYVEIKYIPEGAPNGVIPDPEENVTVDFETGDLSQLTNTNSGISYTNDATYPWIVVSNGQSGFNGTYCMKSGNGGQADTESSITVTAVYEEDGTISFMGGCWGEGSTYDVCRFYIDDQQQFSTGNAQAWNTYTYSVSAGTHTFTWNYKKDYSVDPTGDAFFVDDIVFTGVHVQNSGEDPEPVYYAGYGQLEGFAHMMAGNPDEDATCAYARPKQSTETGNILPSSASAYYNTNDGGWVSYTDDDNEYDAGGGMADPAPGVQLRYENHVPNLRDNSEYYRIWRKGSDHYTQEAYIHAHAEGNAGVFKTVEVEVELPSWGKAGSYYRFDRTNNTGANNTLIDYGSQVMTFNGANYSYPLDAHTWMFWQDNATTPQVTDTTATDATVAAALGQQGIMNNPNLNFGLVIEPGLTMESTDVNYIINSASDSWLASVEKPFNCHDNNHKPTVKLVLTYSDELTANATLDPVLIKLVQCDAQGNITDYVTIKLIISTSTQITTGFRTQMYARMDGSTNTREIATASVVLPTFNVAEIGEDAKFYLKKAEFKQEGGEVIVASHGSSVICAETADRTDLNIDRFAMSIGAQPNPDNSDDWRNPSGQQDAVQPSTTSTKNKLLWGQSNNRGVFLGEGKGRNPLSMGINLYYNSNENATAKTKMGEMEFTIEVRNIEGGTGDYTSSEFTIIVEVYRVGPGSNFFVDGINGVDLADENRAKFPDKAAKTVNFIFNRLGYMAGDNIIVVNELPINKTTTWDGSAFQNNVKMYRYPGGHPLTTTEGIIIDNENNDPYMGPLVDVTSGELNMKGIIMDGMYAEATTTGAHNTIIYPTAASGLGNCTFDGISSAPLITISNGARVNLTNTKLQNNYNNSTTATNLGGAVHVNYEGILAMNVDNTITGNYNTNGGGVYVDGSLIVSDYEYIYNNYTKLVSSKDEPEQNNVFLALVDEGSFRVVQLGTSASNDAFDALLPGDDGETKIGVTKTDWDHGYDGYMPVVYAEAGTLSYLNDPYNTQSMVVHDDNLYKLERYTTTEHADSPRYLYWMGTWVTAVTSEPTGFQANSIDTPEELAWAISLVNGENGCTPNAGLNFTLTDDINMEDNIWVPIGNESVLYNGTFEGNGHVVTGLHGTISRTDMGMFGRTDDDAVIQNMVVHTAFTSSADNLGTVVGNMGGGTLSNVEGAGENTNKNTAGNNGGLVGVNGGTIHSAFAVTTIKGGANMGGLVAVNNGNLLNAYSAATISDGTAMAGLVATNNGLVENCYDATDADVAFAVKNNGTIRYCYTAEVEEGDPTYVEVPVTGSTLEKHGTYAAPYMPHTYGYMYDDNKVTLEGENATSEYVVDAINYAGNKISTWPGLLSSLNQWVEATNVAAGGDIVYTQWFRPTTQYINGDLPVLGFPMDNSLGTTVADGKYLAYGSIASNANGLDNMLYVFNEKVDDAASSLFLYGNATEVTRVPESQVKVSINEDVVLKQASTAGKFINATVGVSFDNSHGQATDFFGNTLAYDWHMLSTPLADAPLGITYSNDSINPWTMNDMSNQVTGVENSYLPDGTGNVGHWDFYSFYEPEYHWVNLKRNSDSHHHFDEPYAHIDYTNEDTLVPGKGYMAAIDKDSYLLNNGTLNGPSNPVSVTLTMKSQAPGTDELGYNLIGNPYQAYLDVNTFLGANGLSSYWVYIAESNNYIAGNADASVNPVLPSSTLHPHQGFFVRANSDGQTVNFNYSTMALETPVADSYFRGDKVNYPLVNLFATGENGKKDLAVIEFNRPEFGGSKKMRAINNANFELSAHMGNQRYSILFTEEGIDRVPVHFVTKEEGTFTLTWETYHGTFTSLFLVDNKTGIRTDMLRSDGYTFEGSPDDYASRFYITFKCIGVDEYTDGEGDFAWFDGNDWIVTGQGQLQLVDVLGHVLQSQYVSGDQTRLYLNGYAVGVYMLRLTDGTKSKVQKIIIK